MSDHLTDCRRLMAAVAPELSDRVYLADDSHGLPEPTSCLGYFQRADSLLDMGDRLPGYRDGQHLLYLDRPRIAAGMPLDLAADILGVFVHELGHALPYRPPAPRPKWVSESVAKEFTAATLDIAAATTGPQNEFHGIDFCRMAIHCWARAAFHGWTANLTGLLRGGPGDGSERLLLPLLLHEVHVMRDQTFADIAATSPPADFTRLWRRLEWQAGRAATYHEIETWKD